MKPILGASTLRVDAPERAGSQQFAVRRQRDSKAQVITTRAGNIPSDHRTSAFVVPPDRCISVAHCLGVRMDLEERSHVSLAQGPKLESRCSNREVRETVHATRDVRGLPSR